MQELEIHDRARLLMQTYGAKAIVEAARKAVDLEAQGDAEQARDWRRVADALKLMRGPHQG